MGNGASHGQSSRNFILDELSLKYGTDVTTLQFTGGDTLEVRTQGGVSCGFKLSSLLTNPDPATPTQWKSVQSLARLSEAGCQRLRGRDLTLTIDYSEDLVADMTFALAGDKPRGLVFIIADNAAELQSLMAKGNEFSGASSKFPNVYTPELTLKERGIDGVNYYNWNWKYVAPTSTGNGTIKSELLPPTGGWKNFCCFGEYVQETKHFRALSVFEFFVSSVVNPLLRQPSQASTLGNLESTSSRRTSILGALDPSPLSLHTEYTDSGLSPRSARSSLSSPITGPPPAPFLMQAAPTHRREHSSTSGNSVTNLEEVDDEPAFRQTIETLEKKTQSLKHAVKQANKQLLTYIQTGRTFMQAGKDLNVAIADIPIVDTAVIQMLKEVAVAVDKQMDIMFQQVENVVLVQSNAMYDQIKDTEGQKKMYDQELKEFNSSEQKYLSMRGQKQKLSEADQKWQEKKKNYELKRLDYYCHLKDLHGAHMERILDMQFIVLAEKQVTMYKSVAEKLSKKTEDLATLSTKWKEVNEKSNEEKRERDERRKLIESKAQLYTEGGHAYDNNAFSDPEDETTPGANRFKGFRDLVQTYDADSAALGRRRKGYLWVAAATEKAPHGQPKANAGQQNWKKMWCVLQKGVLREYNLKRNHQEETYTTNLRFCTIRDSRNIDRRFSFEVISGGGGKLTKRHYQATDAEDMKAWMAVIQNSIQGMLSGTATVSENTNSGPEFGVGPHGMGPSSDMVWALDDPFVAPVRALDVLREADPGNSVCAECGAKNPDWISINLGCLLCIDCSGSHRKLGTHITKIRSLTLDQSWTPDLIAMLKSLGNTKCNSIFEALLPPDTTIKPTVKDPRDTKEKFIRDKYVHGLYLDRASAPDATALLYRAAENRDIPEMLRAVALGADLAAAHQDRPPILLVALGYPSAPAPAPPRRESSMSSSPSATTSPSLAPISAPMPSNPRLKTAEFVVQNGANLNAVNTVPFYRSAASSSIPGSPAAEMSENLLPANMAAVHYAALYHDVEALAFLISKGADLLQKDSAGNTPLSLVEQSRPTLTSITPAISSAKLPDLPPLPDAPPPEPVVIDAAAICVDKLRYAIAKLHTVK
ncbi:hypothetical protein DFJ77DRAFT_359341 [Powellomyces hirtus]|nr:hypothetical protein DFJ77DRAFT_359341 [Powellomyces hirtus]